MSFLEKRQLNFDETLNGTIKPTEKTNVLELYFKAQFSAIYFGKITHFKALLGSNT